VMASDRPAVKEIAGEAALLIDPEDCASMAKAIARLDQDDALIASLSSAGRINGARFSIPAYAARLEQVYAELAESKP
jgi:glycosyltransferase involved in cell wall biosynthesis